MSTPHQERPSTYFVSDRSNEEELTRLQLQEDLLTSGMGGVLPEQLDPTTFERVLDIGCGTGGWLIAAAQTYPTMKLLIGVDISHKMVEYAQARAQQAGVADRVEFHVMDALGILAFPYEFFDLVNERLTSSWLRTWDWPKFLQECQRVTRSHGIIRITECDLTQNNGPAVNRFYDLLLASFYQAGHYFALDRRSMIDQLAPLLRRQGIENVQTRSHALEYRAGTQACQSFAENVMHGFRTLRPFFQKWTHLPADYESLPQQALQEMQQPDFVATWTLCTAWGTRSSAFSPSIRQ